MSYAELGRVSAIYLMMEFRQWAKEKGIENDADYFDPRNRDEWMRSFGEFLQGPREFASND